MESRMCRFVRDGEPDIGEYRELADGTGICVLADMNGDSEEVVVSLPDGTMPENISDLELLKVPTTMHGPESGPLTPAEVAERMARTDFMVVPEFLRTLVFARPRGDDQFADCTFSPSLDMSR